MAREVVRHADSSESILRLPLPRLAENSSSTSRACVRALSDEDVYRACGTRIAFTFRDGGVSTGPYESLNLFYGIGDIEQNVNRNRRILLEAFGLDPETTCLLSSKQVHGSDVVVVKEIEEARRRAGEGEDGIVCDRSDTAVLLCSADCVSIILVAPNGAFAVLHSGWRGTFAMIAQKGMEKLTKATNCLPSDVNCYIGPHIGSCCYEVDSALIQKFVRKFGSVCDAGDNHLDLSAAVRIALCDAGALPERITDSGLCTSCRVDLLYSYRAEAGVTGRHGAFAFRKELT